MNSGFQLSPRALADLEAIRAYRAEQSGEEAAEALGSELLDAFSRWPISPV